MSDYKSFGVENHTHKLIKDLSVRTGVPMNKLLDNAIRYYIKSVKIEETETEIVLPKG